MYNCNSSSFLQSDDEELVFNRRPRNRSPDGGETFNFVGDGRKRQRSQTSSDDDDYDDFDLPYEDNYDDSAFFDPAAEVPNSNAPSAASSANVSAASTPATTPASTPASTPAGSRSSSPVRRRTRTTSVPTPTTFATPTARPPGRTRKSSEPTPSSTATPTARPPGRTRKSSEPTPSTSTGRQAQKPTTQRRRGPTNLNEQFDRKYHITGIPPICAVNVVTRKKKLAKAKTT